MIERREALTPLRTAGALESDVDAVSQIVAKLGELRGRFPGMQADPRVVDVFYNPETRTVRIIGTDGSFDPIRYELGGSVDYDIQARRSSRPIGSPSTSVGPFYQAGEIWTINNQSGRSL